MTVSRAVCAALALALAGVGALGATGAQAAGARLLVRGMDSDARLWAVSVGGGLIGYSSAQPPAGSRLRRHCRGDYCRSNAYVTDTRSARSREIGAQPALNH